MRRFFNKLLVILEKAMLHSTMLEEADFRMRYFHHWAKSQASDIEHGIEDKCRDAIHYCSNMRKK
jgi:hypothetical protein